MRRFNLYETSADLKIKLKVNKFFGESSHSPNANIAPKTCIPVLLINEENQIYLHSMRWGIDIFNSGRNVTHIARSEKLFDTNSNNNPWLPLNNNNRRCVIICKGFYLWHNTEVLSVRTKTVKVDRQPYYVSPNKGSEGQFFYVCGLYKEKRSYQGRSYSVVSLSQSSTNNDRFIGYVERIPLMIHRSDIRAWLHGSLTVGQNGFGNGYKIETVPFRKIGLWVNDSDNKSESIVLQSRMDWNLENEASILGLDGGNKGFDFDLIEKEALRQNKMRKLGLTYDKRNWDNLEELSDGIEDKELKEEEYNDKSTSAKREYLFNDESESDKENGKESRKRQRSVSGSGSDEESGLEPPLHKKRRGNSIETEGLKKPISRRRSLDLNENNGKGLKRRLSGKTASSH